MKICITVGHSILKSGACTSANGVVNEYQYNKSLAPVLADTFRKEGHKADVIICPETQFKTKAEEKIYKIPRVNSVEDVVSEGQEVEVYVLDVNKETKKIALALKDINNDPWDLIA
ncbi:S1 RNA-binding domain-containing protein, partial [Clostridioides difficile]|uniref:S1 RNA-binding domain-containing protein n=1 Tax=Clostridioides difficile TaxID=1496 RepID=UPI0031B598C9